MATSTARLALRKPDGDPSTGDLVDVDTDLNDNFDKIDDAVGLKICTNATRPTGADRWDGREIYETDTRRTYFWSAALGLWIPLVNARTGTGPYLFNTSTDTSGEGINIDGSTAGAHVWRSRVAADSQARLTVEAGGLVTWGSGSVAGDTNLYRSAANVLKTDDSFVVGGSLTVTGVGAVLWTRKTADHSLTVSSTTFQNVQIGAAASGDWTLAYTTGVWEFVALLTTIGPTAADIKIRFSFNTGSSSRFLVAVHAPDLANTTSSGSGYFLASNDTVSPGTGFAFSTYDVSLTSAHIRGTLVANAAGTVGLQAAQNTSNASAVKVGQDSWMRLTKRE